MSSETGNNNEDAIKINLKAEENLLKRIKEKFADFILDAQIPRKNRVTIKIKPEAIKEIAHYLKTTEHMEHLSCITGIDWPSKPEHKIPDDTFYIGPAGTIEIAYIIGSWKNPILVTLRAFVSRDDPVIESISSLWKSADYMEREVYDMLGVKFEGHPNLKRILLPDDWDELDHPDPSVLWPMRKDYKLRPKPFQHRKDRGIWPPTAPPHMPEKK